MICCICETRRSFYAAPNGRSVCLACLKARFDADISQFEKYVCGESRIVIADQSIQAPECEIRIAIGPEHLVVSTNQSDISELYSVSR